MYLVRNPVVKPASAEASSRPDISKITKFSGIADQLKQYLKQPQTSCYSVMRYFLFIAPTPRLLTREDAIVKSILTHILMGFFKSTEEIVLRLSLIDTRENEPLSACIQEISIGRRPSFIATEAQKALSIFLNLFYCDPWNLSNIGNPELFIQIEKIGLILQKKVCELQSEMIFENDRAKYFLKYIDAYLDCFSLANNTFCVGTVFRKDQASVSVKEHLSALSRALDNTRDLLPLEENKDKCSALMERINKIQCHEFGITPEKPPIKRLSNVYWKF